MSAGFAALSSAPDGLCVAASPPSACRDVADGAERAWDQEKLRVRAFVRSVAPAESDPTQIRVAIFSIGGNSRAATEHLPTIMEAEPPFTWELLTPDDIRARALDRFDVVLFPGGSGKKQGAALDTEGRRAVRAFVSNGGGLVGICAGAFLTTTTFDVYLGLLDAKTKSRPGAFNVGVEMTESGRKIFPEFPHSFEARFAGGPLLSPAARDDLADYLTLGRYCTQFGTNDSKQGTMVNTPAIIAAEFGKGRVIAFGFHPEVWEGTQPLVKQAVLATAPDNRDRPPKKPP